jgi:hypothetical protein
VPIYPACSGEVKELRDFFKKTGFIKVSKIKQAKKHSEHNAKNSDRLACKRHSNSWLAKTLIENFRQFENVK